MHNEEFSIDCYALALDSFDVVLAVQWLKTLGPLPRILSIFPWNSSTRVVHSYGMGLAVPALALPLLLQKETSWTHY
jgi:hypothetical protein